VVVAGLMLHHATLWVLLLGGAAAVGVCEWRRRVALAAAGGQTPSTERYLVGPALVLARVEAGRLVRHPFLWLGLAGTVLAVSGLFTFQTVAALRILVIDFFPLLIGAFAAIHLAVGRDRRTGMEELAHTLPAGPRTRTLGHLLASAWLAAPLAVAAVATVLARLGPDRTLVGDDVLPSTPPVALAWTPGVLELAQPALAVAIVLALAVAAGRWWRHAAAAFLIPLLLISNYGLNAHGVPLYRPSGPRWAPDGFAGHTAGEFLGHVGTWQLGWHAVFLAGYLTVAVALALARHDRRPVVLALGGVGLAAMIAGFVVKTPTWAWLA
jgi:hypothetical protein